MGTAQYILLAGSLLLLVTLSLTFYRSYRSQSDLSINSQALSTAVTVGQSMFNQIQSRAFDEKTTTKAFSTPDSLTPVASLGAETGESIVTQFDDVDDFNNYVQYDTLGIFGIFRTKVTVKYVTKMNPNVLSASRTFSKIANIWVSNQYLTSSLNLTDTLKLKHVITY